MSHSLFQQLLKHKRSFALASWTLCAVLIGCLMGKTESSAITSFSDVAELSQEHRVHGHAKDHGIAHSSSGGLMTADTCCETEHDVVSLSVIASLIIPLGLALAILLPGLGMSGTAWLRRNLVPSRIRPPRYHIVYCSLIH